MFPVYVYHFLSLYSGPIDLSVVQDFCAELATSGSGVEIERCF